MGLKSAGPASVFAATLLAVGASLAARGASPPQEHGAGNTKRDAALQGGIVDSREVQVIIRTRPGETTQVTKRLLEHQHRVLAQHALIDAVSAVVDVDGLAHLDADGSVESVSLDAEVTSGSIDPPESSAPDTLLATLGLPAARLTGDGVGVAVIDSGLQSSEDFRHVYFRDYTAGHAGNPYDDYGHGTHVSGLIASSGLLSNGTAYRGIAPGVRLISLKVLDARGRGRTSTVIQAIEFAVANRERLGIDIINLSLGHPILEPAHSDPLVQAVEAAVRAGIVVVVSAGNFGRNATTGLPGYAGILSPGNAPSAITVGATDTKNTTTRRDDTVPTYSSRGPTWYDGRAKPDLVAPGHNLIADAALGSTLYAQYPDRRVPGIAFSDGGNDRDDRNDENVENAGNVEHAGNVGNAGNAGDFVSTGGHYFRLSGTSMAAAVTSGVAALVIEGSRHAFKARPTPNLVKAILEYTALPMPGYDALTQGRGELNAAGAVALAHAIKPWLPIGSLWLKAPVHPATTIAADTWPWAQAVVWGNTIVWGNVLAIHQPAWAQTVVWGDTVVWGNAGDLDTVVWGNFTNDVVWDNTILWGNSLVWGGSVVWGNWVDVSSR